MILPIGTLVRVLPPFESEEEQTIASVQYIDEDGLFVEDVTDNYQYVLSSGIAYVPQYIEAI